VCIWLNCAEKLVKFCKIKDNLCGFSSLELLKIVWNALVGVHGYIFATFATDNSWCA
jgi:hypothetical protein